MEYYVVPFFKCISRQVDSLEQSRVPAVRTKQLSVDSKKLKHCDFISLALALFSTWSRLSLFSTTYSISHRF